MIEDVAPLDQPVVSQIRPARIKTCKRAKLWLSITGSNEEELEAWFRRTARAIANERDLRERWSKADVDYLLVHPSPIGYPDEDSVQFVLRGSRLEVIDSSADLSKSRSR